jgi:hypothetical protein
MERGTKGGEVSHDLPDGPSGKVVAITTILLSAFSETRSWSFQLRFAGARIIGVCRVIRNKKAKSSRIAREDSA